MPTIVQRLNYRPPLCIIYTISTINYMQHNTPKLQIDVWDDHGRGVKLEKISSHVGICPRSGWVTKKWVFSVGKSRAIYWPGEKNPSIYRQFSRLINHLYVRAKNISTTFSVYDPSPTANNQSIDMWLQVYCRRFMGYLLASRKNTHIYLQLSSLIATCMYEQKTDMISYLFSAWLPSDSEQSPHWLMWTCNGQRKYVRYATKRIS